MRQRVALRLGKDAADKDCSPRPAGFGVQATRNPASTSVRIVTAGLAGKLDIPIGWMTMPISGPIIAHSVGIGINTAQMYQWLTVS
jgi:hypothetical protein